MKKITILLLLFISFTSFAQKAKNKGWYINELHYPEILAAKNYKTYKLVVNENSENIKLIINTELFSSLFKNPKIAKRVNHLIKLPGYEKSLNPDFEIIITDLGLEHIMYVSKKKSYGSNKEKKFTGFLDISSSMKVLVRDVSSGEILFEKVFVNEGNSEKAGVYKNASIKSKYIALLQIKNQYKLNAREYRVVKNTQFVDMLIRNVSKVLKSKFSTYYESKRVNLFTIKKAEKYGFTAINNQVDKLISLNGEKHGDLYAEKLIKFSKESLQVFEDELTKITDFTDKKQAKIHWSILSNISAVYYALGDYEKAIEYAKKRKEVGYNKKWKYNLEISEDRKEIVDKYNARMSKSVEVNNDIIIDPAELHFVKKEKIAVLIGDSINLLDDNLKFVKELKEGTLVNVLSETARMYTYEDKPCGGYKYVKININGVEGIVNGRKVYALKDKEFGIIDKEGNNFEVFNVSYFGQAVKRKKGDMEFCYDNNSPALLMINRDIIGLIEVVKDEMYKEFTSVYEKHDFFQFGGSENYYDFVKEKKLTDKGILIKVNRSGNLDLGEKYKVLFTKGEKGYTAKYLKW